MGRGLAAGAVEVVRSYCDAWLNGDTLAVLGLYHDDLTLQWSGRHRFAGTHDGQQASIAALLGLQAVTNRVPVRIVDVLEGAESVAVVVEERWTRDGEESAPEVLEHRRVLDYTVENGKLRTCRIYESAQREVDDWIDATDATAGPPTVDHDVSMGAPAVDLFRFRDGLIASKTPG
ncbi:MAG: nuclear transport factor 2 family protein [Desertimonas sp.]